MAKPSILDINTTQTFQNWLDKTNELVELFRTNAITASGAGGDTTIGNATLSGIFTADTLIADNLFSADTISSQTAGATIVSQSPLRINSPGDPVALILNYGATGGRARFTNGTVSWDAGLQDSVNGNFIIDTGVAPVKFTLSPAGTLTVPNIIVSEDVAVTGAITATSFTGDGSGLTNVSTVANINDLTDVAISSPSAGQVLKYDGSNWVNGTDDTAGGAGLNADTLDSLNSTQFLRSDVSDTFAGTLTINGTLQGASSTLNISGDVVQNGGSLTVGGDVRATGNVITNYSASDRALKENLQIINNALDKVAHINGYTFNYIGKPEDKVAGLVAQEVEKVLPEVVFDFESEEGKNVKAIHYGNVVSLLVEAVKELKGKIEELENNKCSCNCDK